MGGAATRRQAWAGAVQARSTFDLVRGCWAEGHGGRRRSFCLGGVRTGLEEVGSCAVGGRVVGFWVVQARSDGDLVGGHRVERVEGRRWGSTDLAAWDGATGWWKARQWVVQARTGCAVLVRDHQVDGGGAGRPETADGQPLEFDRWFLGLG